MTAIGVSEVHAAIGRLLIYLFGRLLRASGRLLWIYVLSESIRESHQA